MHEISVSARRGAPEDTGADTRVVPLFDGESLDRPDLRALVESGEARSGLKRLCVTHEEAPTGGLRRVIVAGAGSRAEFDAERARVVAAAATGRARELGTRELSWSAPDGDGIAAGLVEGTLLSLYEFDRFKSDRDDDDRARLAALEVAAGDDRAEEVERARCVTLAQNRARDLQNLPANVATPAFLADRAMEIAREHDAVEAEAHGPGWIEEQRMGAFAAVARGSEVEPRFIVLRYRGGDRGPHLGFVGKAVTFDTGGISIKPSAKMHEMKFDMSGGAAVIESIAAIAELGLPVTITALVPAAENMPSGRSVKPGDIVTARNGTTIEVNNTDAEGRLLLADALAYAADEGCERIVDLATLTGAIIVALGSTYAGLFSNDDEWCAELEAAGATTGELGWRMPLHPEYLELTKGRYADLSNAAEQRKAPSCYAAEFLRRFVGDRPWVHMDIAGVAWGMTRNYVGGGASGFGVRTLCELARRAAG